MPARYFFPNSLWMPARFGYFVDIGGKFAAGGFMAAFCAWQGFL